MSGRKSTVIIAAVVATIAACLVVVRLLGGTAPESKMVIPPAVGSVETYGFYEPALGELNHAAADTRLESYGWVNQKAGTIHIPIDVAIDLYLEGREHHHDLGESDAGVHAKEPL